MKGIVKALDDLGRIVIPIEIRRSAKINSGDRIGFEINGRSISIKADVRDYIGMTRPVDHLGRVVVPSDIRKALKFADNELIDMWVEDGTIHIRKAGLQCVICESEDERQLMKVDEVLICRSCGEKVADKFRKWSL